MRLQEGVRLPIVGVLIWLTPLLFESCSAAYSTLRGGKPCSLCPSGGTNFEFPDASIPYFILPEDDAPSCSDLAFVASMVPSDSYLCAKYQANAGYCGCPDLQPLNNCSFCPNGNIPARAGLLLPTGESCKNLHTYVSFFDEDQCSSLQYDAIAANADGCGCETGGLDDSALTKKALDLCSFCPDGSIPPDLDKYMSMAGLTCGEYAKFITSLNRDQCEIQSNRGTFDLFAFQCNCPEVTPPVCPRQENPDLCTVSLLETVDVDESCECYSFCDEKFVGCDAYPGNFLLDKCPGTSVSGCNFASAIDDSGSCSICPNFTNDISNPDAILPPFSGVTIPGIEQPTCQDLVDYIQNKSVEDEDCQVAQSRLAHYCGCDGAESSCTLCPGGIQPSYADKITTGDTTSTCKEFAGTVLTWEQATCEIGESYLSVMAGRCGCITAEMPVCPVQQNPWLCTVNLLRSTDEDCECYNFCGNKFHSCAEYPGQLLSASDCPENVEPIAGCNRALASPTSKRCGRGSIGPPCSASLPRHLRHY